MSNILLFETFSTIKPKATIRQCVTAVEKRSSKSTEVNLGGLWGGVSVSSPMFSPKPRPVLGPPTSYFKFKTSLCVDFGHKNKTKTVMNHGYFVA